jgi:hypothetical protein
MLSTATSLASIFSESDAAAVESMAQRDAHCFSYML